MCTEKNTALSLLGAEKIAFPPKPDKRTDMDNYRVASLLNKDNNIHTSEAKQIRLLDKRTREYFGVSMKIVIFHFSISKIK